MSLPFLTYACVLCEDFLHFLSTPSITERSLCEETPKYLFGDSPAAESVEKSFSLCESMENHILGKTKLFLWHFEAKNPKNASEYRSFVCENAHSGGLAVDFFNANSFTAEWLQIM